MRRSMSTAAYALDRHPVSGQAIGNRAAFGRRGAMPRIHSGQVLPSGIVTFRRVICNHNHNHHGAGNTWNGKGQDPGHHVHSSNHSCNGHDHDHEHEHQHEHGSSQVHSHEDGHGPCNHDHDHHHENDHEHVMHGSSSHGDSHDHSHSHSHSHPHSHDHNHSHDHDHCHSHSHSHSEAGHAHFQPTAVSRALTAMGLTQLGSQLGHSVAWSAVSITCYVAALLSGRLLAPPQAAAVQAVGLAGTYFLSGLPQLIESACIAASGNLDTHVLMTMAVFGTMFLGMAQEGALLLLLFQISHMLEEKLTERARGSLKRLFASVPSQATLVDLDPSGGPSMQSARVMRAGNVECGQHVLVKPGEQVPLDGSVAWGMASVSQQHITGESLPVRMQVGSFVPAGCLNIDGVLVVKVTARADDSTPARIARMAEAAQMAKPPLERQLDHIGAVWSKAVVAATLATLLLLPCLGVPLFGPHGAFYRAMGVLTAGSPCALALAPLAYVCAISTITRKGVLVRNASSLDGLNACRVVALDKTGTLTTGTLDLTDVSVLHSSLAPDTASDAAGRTSTPAAARRDATASATSAAGGCDASAAAMQYCVALSLNSNHPVSRAVAAAGKALPCQRNIQVAQFEQVPGLGICGVSRLHPDLDLQTVRFGSSEYIKMHLPTGSPAARLLEEAEARQKSASSSKAMSFLSLSRRQPGHEADAGNGRQQPEAGQPPHAASNAAALEPDLLAMFCFEDAVDPRAQRAVAALTSGSWRRRQGGAPDSKRVVMLTGDGEQVAHHVAAQLDIASADVHAGLKPEDKLAYINAVQHGGAVKQGLLMMGDGINDAPALAAATVGVAVAATPDDLVSAAADIIILNGGGVSNLPWLFKVARDTRHVIKQNVALALLSVIFATLPTLAGVFPLWLAVLLHEGATVLVVVSSLRLLLDPQPGSLAPPAAAASKQVVAEVQPWTGDVEARISMTDPGESAKTVEGAHKLKYA